MKAFLLSAVAWLMSLIPPRFAHAIARPLAWLIWNISKRLRTVSLVNLQLCYPDWPDDKREQVARNAMRHYVRNGIEMGIMWHWSQQRFDGLFDDPVGSTAFFEALALGKGVIVLSPHCGAWEMLGLRISEELDGATLYKPGSNSEIEKQLIEKRGRFGAQLVPANRRGLKVLFQSLGKGQCVGILPDQEPNLGDGRFAPFFGVPALTGVLVPKLIQRTGAKAVFAICSRRPGGRYRIHTIPAHEDLYSGDLDKAVAAINRGVEQCIEIDPDQYLWGYKRFRARPDGERTFY